jgi:hypothetical protein
MTTFVKCYILDGGVLSTFENLSYSSHDQAALETGISDLFGDIYYWDPVTKKHVYRPYNIDIQLFDEFDEDYDSDDDSYANYSGRILFRDGYTYQDKKIDCPSDWAAKFLNKTFVLNDPEKMHPLLPCWGWPWKNKVEIHFSMNDWEPPSAKPEPVIVKPMVPLVQPVAKPLLSVSLDATTNKRTITLPSVKPVWKRDAMSRLVRV